MKITHWIKENKFLLILLLGGAIFRIYKLDFQSIWIDELFSMIHADPKQSYLEIYKYIRENDQHMPLHYFSLHFMFQVFGESTFTARMVSVIMGLGGIAAIYNLGRELMNKKVGLYAALFLTVNWFHIYYSQEARMYTMLFLTTSLSFYFLIKFLKKPDLKSTLFYALFATIMLYTHIFGIFTLFAQCFILLFFWIRPFRIQSMKFLLYCLLAGVSIAILYIPGILILLQNSKMNSIWIPMPSIDVYTQMFKEFFGNAEILLYIVCLAIFFFLIKLFERSSKIQYFIDPVEEKQVFTFFVLFTWIFAALLPPLVISYLKLPMLMSRYLIHLLPAVILLVAGGIHYIKSNLVRSVFILLFVAFSITDLIVVKDYYNKVTKEQFRELTNEVRNRNPNRSKLVFYWNWLLPYFYKDEQIAMEASTLEQYVSGLKNGSIPKSAFWYLDGHSRPFSLTPDDVNFLAQNFVLQEKLEFYDAWANYYVPIGEQAEKEELSLRLFRPSKLDGNGNMALYNNATVRTRLFDVEKGDYNLVVKGLSLPSPPLNNKNAHIIIKMDKVEVANFVLSEKSDSPELTFPIHREASGKARFEISYDNDEVIEGVDRNAIINYIKLVKNSK